MVMVEIIKEVEIVLKMEDLLQQVKEDLIMETVVTATEDKVALTMVKMVKVVNLIVALIMVIVMEMAEIISKESHLDKLKVEIVASA